MVKILLYFLSESTEDQLDKKISVEKNDLNNIIIKVTIII